ncbi:MAG: MotA/TolQ/ExbB proton channel family protein [Armatimonadota bacterium]|nr:MotA/TolQ/ExbB proton channel family protein [Armatimonadota bacterium]
MATIPWLILLLLLWGGCWLGLRVWLGRRERQMMDSELTKSILRMIRSGHDRSTRAALRALHGIPDEHLGVFLGRARTALEEWDRGRDISQVRQSVLDEGYIDGDTLEGSLNIVRVFIWAAPIIGFIGTVLGISLSIGEFSTMIGGTGGTMQMAQVQQGLVTVTGGLAYAFNTTLVGLVVALLLMIPTTYVQRFEDDLLGQVHKQIADLVLPALSREEAEPARPWGPDVSGVEETTAAIGEAAEIMQNVEEALRKHSSALSEQVAALGGIDDSLNTLQRAQMASQKQHDQTLAALNGIGERLGALYDALSESPGALADMRESLDAIAAAREDARRAEVQRREQDQAMLATLQEIRASVQGSHEVLASARDIVEALPRTSDVRETRSELIEAIGHLAAGLGGPFEVRLAPSARHGENEEQ